MTAKETKIKEAYISAGVDWERSHIYIDSNGWMRCNVPIAINFMVETKFMPVEGNANLEYWHHRPISLSGIETNNGWIAIESENDLPPDGHYWTINKNGEINASPKLVDETCNDNQYWISTFTHYQPILKPKPPIY